MKLYLDNGYVNIKAIYEHESIFKWLYGGRGTGKTYGVLAYMIENNIKFMYLRRLASQVDIIKRDEMQPFKVINDDKRWDIHPFSINKYVYGFYHTDVNADGKLIPKDNPVGLLSNLSTFSNIRGFDASSIDCLILDEFIPELTERPIKDEASALFNAYETINRNRELKGKEPIKLICLANANRIDNPIFIELNLVRVADKIRKEGKEYIYDSRRKMLLVDLYKSKISEQKAETALYKLTAGTDFYNMSIKNVFINEEKSRIESRNIKEYKPIVNIGEICIYKHKSRYEYYVTSFKSGAPDVYYTSQKSLEIFKKKYFRIWQAYFKEEVIFEEYINEILFIRYFDK